MRWTRSLTVYALLAALSAPVAAEAESPAQPSVHSDAGVPRRGARPHWWIGKHVRALLAAWGHPSETLRGQPSKGLTSVRYVLRPYRHGDPGILVEFLVNRWGRIISADSMLVVNGDTRPGGTLRTL